MRKIIETIIEFSDPPNVYPFEGPNGGPLNGLCPRGERFQNGKNNQGTMSSSGIYFIKISTENESYIGKVSFIK